MLEYQTFTTTVPTKSSEPVTISTMEVVEVPPLPTVDPESEAGDEDERIRKKLMRAVGPYIEELVCLDMVQGTELRANRDLWRGLNGPSELFYTSMCSAGDGLEEMSKERLTVLYQLLRHVKYLAGLPKYLWPDPAQRHYVCEAWGYNEASDDKKMRSVFAFFTLMHAGPDWHTAFEMKFFFPVWKKRSIVQDEIVETWDRRDIDASLDTFFWECWDEDNRIRFFYDQTHIAWIVQSAIYQWSQIPGGHDLFPCIVDGSTQQTTAHFAWNNVPLSNSGPGHAICTNKVMLRLLKPHHLKVSWWAAFIKILQNDNRQDDEIDPRVAEMLRTYLEWEESTPEDEKELPYNWRR